MYKYISIALLSITISNNAIAKKKKPQTAQIKADITYLADDKLEGRRTGTTGEKLAADYIVQRFTQLGIQPYGNTTYIQNWQVADGSIIADNAEVTFANNKLQASDYAPLPCSAPNAILSELVMNNVKEKGMPLIIAAATITTKNLSNPHDEAMAVYEKYITNLITTEQPSAIIIYNNIDSTFDYSYNGKAKTDKVHNIPVYYVNYAAAQKYVVPQFKNDWVELTANYNIEPKTVIGNNVTAYINNHAATTVIIGAHYDHLGYGDDHNSLFTGGPAIHNGADDNASGTAALLAIAEQLKDAKKQKNNYVFVAFSGEELGLYGSKKFVEQYPSLLDSTNYMINMDMVGRYDEDKKALTIGGVGTSPLFIPTIEKSKKFFTSKYDSAGVGPSDHTSFYLKNKPVLFFFTGLHTDYHKPTDDADKINYEGETKIVNYIVDLVQALNKKGTLPFTKTKEPKMEGVRFKVSLGIMPDYTFSGTGVKADGVTEGKPAKAAGIQAGDIIVQIGEHKTLEMQSYMQALSKFKKGDVVKVKLMRGTENLEVELTF